MKSYTYMTLYIIHVQCHVCYRSPNRSAMYMYVTGLPTGLRREQRRKSPLSPRDVRQIDLIANFQWTHRGCSKSWPQLSRSLLYARTCSRTKYSCEWAWRDYFITHLMIDSSHCCGSNVLRLYIPVWPSLKKDHRTNSRLYFALTWTITYMMYMYRDIVTILRQAIRKQNHIPCATRSLCQIFAGPRLHVFSLLLAHLAILNTGQECSTRLFLERRTFPGCLSRDLHFSLSQQYPYVRYCPLHVNFFCHFSFFFNTWEHILKSYCTKEETDMTDYS